MTKLLQWLSTPLHLVLVSFTLASIVVCAVGVLKGDATLLSVTIGGMATVLAAMIAKAPSK